MTIVQCAMFLFIKQKTAYEVRIRDWSSDLCSSDLLYVLGELVKRRQDVLSGSLSRLGLGVALAEMCNLGRQLPPLYRFDIGQQRLFMQPMRGAAELDRCDFQALAQCFVDLDAECRCSSEEHTSELHSLIRLSFAVFCLKKKTLFLFLLHSISFF